MPQPETPIRAIAFDMDGLLANSEDVYDLVGTETLSRRGKVFDDDLRTKMMGQTAGAALQVMIDFHQLDDTIPGLIAESEQLFWQFAEEHLQQMPAAQSLLDAIKERDLPHCLVTSGGRDYAERVLETIGLSHEFQFLITGDDVTNGKPAPEPYLTAAEQLAASAGSLMVLEDSGNGCQAGVAAGAYTVAVPNNHTQKHNFTGAAFVAQTLADPRIIEAIQARRASE